jgi:hypothetical protein
VLGGRPRVLAEMLTMDGFAASFPELPAEVDAAWLRRWQRDHRFTNAAAAARLGLSERAYLRQKTGRSCVTRQTFLLSEYVRIHDTAGRADAERASRSPGSPGMHSASF